MPAVTPGTISSVETILRLLIAALTGSVIGLERERLQWAAGLRTHMLVCVGSCLIVIVSAYGFAEALGPQVVLDPSRIAAQVVSGIGFLGAGTILLRGEVVKGLTTAASLWAVAAIGLAVGTGLYVAAVATTAIVLTILAGIKPLEERVRARMQTRQVTVLAKRGEMTIATLRGVMGGHAGRMRQFVLRPDTDDDSLDRIEVTLTHLPHDAVAEIAAKLRALPCVVAAEVD